MPPSPEHLKSLTQAWNFICSSVCTCQILARWCLHKVILGNPCSALSTQLILVHIRRVILRLITPAPQTTLRVGAEPFSHYSLTMQWLPELRFIPCVQYHYPSFLCPRHGHLLCLVCTCSLCVRETTEGTTFVTGYMVKIITKKLQTRNGNSRSAS